MGKGLRIVLVGKTGVGKSGAGNTILGRNGFRSRLSFSSVTSVSRKERAEVKGREVYVIDTPGLFDTNVSKDTVVQEIVKCISLSSPGPHVFLIVIQLGTFTKEEHDTVKMIKEIFGTKSDMYSMVLFTYGEKLEGQTIEDFLSESTELQQFTAQCHGGYHVFCKDQNNRSQVTELLQKIDRMVALNGGGCYTTEMYQQVEAERKKHIEDKIKKSKWCTIL